MYEFRYPEEALDIETYVELERGRWVVSIVVIFADGAVRKTINSYNNERMATLAASWIKRAARRDSPMARPSNTAPTQPPTDTTLESKDVDDVD